MVELVGDYIEPSEIVVPLHDAGTSQPTMSGALFVSGAKLYFVPYGSGTVEIITSAAA